MIVLSGSGQRSSHTDDSSDGSSVSHDGSTTTARSRERQSDTIHKNFRLWLTTRTDTGRLIPGGCMEGWVGGWVGAWRGGWVGGCIEEWVCGFIDGWVHR